MASTEDSKLGILRKSSEQISGNLLSDMTFNDFAFHNIKHPCDNTLIVVSSGIALKLVRCFSVLLRVLSAS